MTLTRIYLLFLVCTALLSACRPEPRDVTEVDSLPEIYPDYVDVTVPVNIAPLNFMLRTPCDAVSVTATAGDLTVETGGRGRDVLFDIDDWHRLMEAAMSDHVQIKVYTRSDGRWTGYRPFCIHVSADSIDPYLTYRLIEPDYEVFSRLEIQERCLEDFSTRQICDYNIVGNRCMNCHTYGHNSPDLSFLYVRGEGGGMILNDGGRLSKLSLKTPDMAAGSVYAQFSPSGRYLVFSTNVIIPAFHSDPSKRLEVFDTQSDIYVADLQTHRVLSSPLLADSLWLETFPTFAPDGRSIYYCTADGPVRPERIDSAGYSLCRISFDEVTGSFGQEVDTLVHARVGSKSSVCHPRLSPDGRYLLYTVADYGTFPIWHREADLRMMHLESGSVDSLGHVNSPMSDTYHSWSSTGRWFVFASKRDDGLYGHPYFCHVDADGEVSRPFVLPQRRPELYEECLRSFNVPELGAAPVRFDAGDVADVLASDPVTFTR